MILGFFYTRCSRISFDYYHYNSKYVHSFTFYFILSAVNYLSMALSSCDTWLQKRNTIKVCWPVHSSLYYGILLICLAMIQNQGKYTLKLLLMCLRVEGGFGGFWKFLCQGANNLTWGGLALGQLRGRRKLWFTLVTQFLIIFFKWRLFLMSI